MVACDVVEFVRDAALTLGSHILFVLLGVPDTERSQVMGWTRSTGERADDAGTSACHRYFGDLLAKKIDGQGADVLATMLNARLERCPGSYLTTPEILAFVHLVHPAGVSATAISLAGAVNSFGDAPEQYARLVEEVDVLDSTVEEVLRWTTPAMYSRRVASVDVELGGCVVRSGEEVTAWLASANRDERVFAEADRFDVASVPNPHLSFGSGPHACLGAGLARIALRAFLEAARERVDGFEAMDAPTWATDGRLLCFARLSDWLATFADQPDHALTGRQPYRTARAALQSV